MARNKIFDPMAALESAMFTFWEHGYEATSTDELVRAMKIGRQSMYDTFGDKKQLYLQALAHYIGSGGASLRTALARGPSPLAALEDFLRQVAGADLRESARGCLSVNAVAEFGQSDPAIHALIRRSQHITENIFADVLAAARAAGELMPGIDTVSTAHVIHSAIRGMRISAKAGAGARQLGATVDFIMAGLRTP